MISNPYQILPHYQREFPPFVQYHGLFAPPECAEIIRLGEANPLLPGSIGNGADSQPIVDPDYRCVQTCRIEPFQAPWAYERLRDRAQWTNDEYFGFDLHGLQQGIVFLRYDAGDKPGKYRWHQDFGGGESSLRKLSLVVQLSDPADYDGCRLTLFTDVEFEAPTTGRGDTILFPSWTPHCVTPITRGRRYALALWVSGPRFR